jgi:Domain of unknown function (DUF4365)
MKSDLDYFIDKRAEDLAIMHLTRHSDVRIERCPEDVGLDLLVKIVQNQQPTGRLFGLQVSGQDRAIATLKELTLASPLPDIDDVNDLPFPVCELLFTMEDDRGYYRWIKSPRLQSSRSALEQTWAILDRTQLERIFIDVNAWYDEKHQSSVA